MSRNPASGQRNARDHYVTPRAAVVPMAAELREWWAAQHGGHYRPPRILDAGSGTGVIAHVMREAFPDGYIVALESDRTYEENLRAMSGADEVVIADFLHYGTLRSSVDATSIHDNPGDPGVDLDGRRRIEYELVTARPFDIIIGNPPFSMWQRFVTRSLLLLAPDGYLAQLLNMHAYGSEERREWWRERKPRAQRILSPRPSFTGGPTDATEYAWIVWRGVCENPDAYNTIEPPFDWYYVEKPARASARRKHEAELEEVAP